MMNRIDGLLKRAGASMSKRFAVSGCVKLRPNGILFFRPQYNDERCFKIYASGVWVDMPEANPVGRIVVAGMLRELWRELERIEQLLGRAAEIAANLEIFLDEKEAAP